MPILRTGLSHCYVTALLSSSEGLTQGRLVIPYRRFGTTYRSHLEGSSRPTFQKSADLICTEAEAWNNAQLQPIRNFSARSGWVVSTTPSPLYPRGKTRYPLCVYICVYIYIYIYIYIHMYNYIYTHTVRVIKSRWDGRECSAYGEEERRIQGFGGETWGIETTWETQA